MYLMASRESVEKFQMRVKRISSNLAYHELSPCDHLKLENANLAKVYPRMIIKQ